MLTLFDYLPSQNAWKVRLLLHHLQLPYRSEMVAIFAGEGQRPDYLAVNPTGAVPAIRLDDGRVLAESNAILFYLARGTAYLPDEAFAQAKILQWLSFEADYVQSTVATLRHWTMTGKLARRDPGLVAGKRAGSEKVLGTLDRYLTTPFLVGEYSVADMAVFAYVHRAGEAELSLAPYPALRAWIDRVAAQPGFLAQTHTYAVDPESGRELP